MQNTPSHSYGTPLSAHAYFSSPREYMHGVLALLLCECIAHVCSRRSCGPPSLPVHLVENKKPVFLRVRRDSGISFLACTSMGTSPYFWQDLTAVWP